MTVDNIVETLFSVGYREPMTTALRDALRAETLVLCLALLHARTPDVPAIAAACGYDAVYVDLEHTSTSLDTAQMLCASALGAGISGLVRVPSNDPSVIARVLDGGAVGVIVPHINSKKGAERVVQAARFPRSATGPFRVPTRSADTHREQRPNWWSCSNGARSWP